MAVTRHDIGLVSAGPDLIEFYATVLGVEQIEPVEFPMGVVRRLQLPGGLLKVMTPSEPPVEPTPVPSFWGRAGYQYATIGVDDLRSTVEAAKANGGQVVMEPMALRPGVEIAVITDPDGNAVELMGETDAS